MATKVYKAIKPLFWLGVIGLYVIGFYVCTRPEPLAPILGCGIVGSGALLGFLGLIADVHGRTGNGESTS